MITFDEMDERLAALGKDRGWLAEITMRSPETVRGALAPNTSSHKKSVKLQKLFSDAIEAEEAKQGRLTVSSQGLMIPFDEIDKRLAGIGKDRNWLTEITPYSLNSIRQALAPAGSARSDRLQKILSDAIESEEEKQGAKTKLPPGYSSIFLNDEQLDRADQASRIVAASSLAEFCREAILSRADEIIEDQKKRSPQFQQAPRNIESLPLAAETPANYRKKA